MLIIVHFISHTSSLYLPCLSCYGVREIVMYFMAIAAYLTQLSLISAFKNFLSLNITRRTIRIYHWHTKFR